jgi:hypothetical protein
VNTGFPLNTVVPNENFLTSRRADPRLYADSVLLAPVPDAGSAIERALLEGASQGQPVLFYGPVTQASPEFLNLFNLMTAAPLGGELEVRSRLEADTIRSGQQVLRLNHRELLSGGGVDTVVRAADAGGCEVVVSVSRAGDERVYAVMRETGGARTGWIRGSVCASIAGGHLPIADDAANWFLGETLLRHMLARFGYTIQVEKPALETRAPLVLAARSRNGFFFSGYSPSTTAVIRLRFPYGAPGLTGAETWWEHGRSTYRMPRAWHREARCLVEQQHSGEVSCIERHSGHMGIRRRLQLRGLKNATVHFYREPGPERVIMAANDPRLANTDSLPYSTEDGGRRLVARGITGELMISW